MKGEVVGVDNKSKGRRKEGCGLIMSNNVFYGKA